ncbi:MAG: hypothetical protein ABJA89_17245 [Lapillicoccus sp.]
MTSSQPSPRQLLTRRAALGLAVGVAALPFAVAAAPTASASRRVVPAPETVTLPDGFRPEGITSGPGTTFYAGSMQDGRLLKGDLITGASAVLVPGATGRQIRGLYWDERTGLVWAVGNVNSAQYVWAIDGASGVIRYEATVAGAGFFNDVVAFGTHAYVTDSRVDRLAVVPLLPNGVPTGAAPSLLPLTGAWPRYAGGNNANGIRDLPDGTLVLNNSTSGGLWQVDPATGVTVALPVTGGPGIIGGDGLERDGDILYNVRGSGPNQVSVLRLSATGGGWTAKWAGARMDETLDVPSTATVAGGWLWAVNARFGIPNPGLAPFWITRLPAR